MTQQEYDGQTLKHALKSAETMLEKRIEEINALNVFPVPDGDTGINMYLTLQSATRAVENLDTTSAAEIAAKAARGALLGARGNSGVILSQILRGMAKGMEMKERFTAVDFARAMRQASDSAYHSIAQPVEGTILTVIRESADRAIQQAEQGADLKDTISALMAQAKDTVNKTPEMLPTLKEAGVVDAGGKGLFYIFQGMKGFITQKVRQAEGRLTSGRQGELMETTGKYGYDLQFLIEGENMPIDEIRAKINSMGESVLVVGDESLIRVHVHTHQSQAVMDYCAARGCLKDIINDNMDEQVENNLKRKAGAKPEGPSRKKPAGRTRYPRLNGQAAGA